MLLRDFLCTFDWLDAEYVEAEPTDSLSEDSVPVLASALDNTRRF